MFSPAHLIQKKRDGEELSPEEIDFFIQGLSTGEVADYQATAFLMAVFFQEMTLKETAALTQSMLQSGIQYDLSHLSGPKVDKHSTGGVGDKVSLVLAPLAAACGLKVPMMSGRGLGHSGGTLDKLESIPGFDVGLSPKKFEALLTKVGCAIIGQSDQIAPADKKLYALRDVTATVECIPLIVASILSKKIAEGTDGLVLDVKVGSGAFMKNRNQAKKLASHLYKVARKMKLPCKVLLTDMSQPLGYAVGNSLEVIESIEILTQEKILPHDIGSSDLKELIIQLTSHMLVVGKQCRSLTEARKLCVSRLHDGSAWNTFKQMVTGQGGKEADISDPLNRLPLSKKKKNFKSKKRGYITKMHTDEFGKILVDIGGGRRKVSDQVDPGVGLVFHKKLGAKVQPGDVLATAYLPENLEVSVSEIEKTFLNSIEVTRNRKAVPKLILDASVK